MCGFVNGNGSLDHTIDSFVDKYFRIFHQVLSKSIQIFIYFSFDITGLMSTGGDYVGHGIFDNQGH